MSASKWKPYPKYSDKGIDWLGEVPAHWEISTPRLMFEQIKDRNTDSARTNFLSLVSKKGIIPYEEKGSMGNKMSVNIDHYTIVDKGDFVLNSMNFGIGGFGVSDYDGITSPAYVVLRPVVEESLIRYLAQIFEDEGFQKGTAILGDGIMELRRAIGWKHLKRQPIPIPTHEERMAISRFLESGTDAIDELIPALQNMLLKLEEKLSAQITQLVTKGLNPDVEMKNSEIEYLDEHPTHWVPRKLLHCFQRIGSGGTPPSSNEEYYIGGDIPWVTTSELRESVIYSTKNKLTRKAISDYSTLKFYPKGTLVVAMYGATIGRLGWLGVPSTVNQACCCFSESIQDINEEFIFYWLLVNKIRYVNYFSSGGGQPNVNQEKLCNIRIPMPTLNEQNKIVKIIKIRFGSFELLINQIQNQIETLKDYQTSLISAAVTGKIDVRGM